MASSIFRCHVLRADGDELRARLSVLHPDVETISANRRFAFQLLVELLDVLGRPSDAVLPVDAGRATRILQDSPLRQDLVETWPRYSDDPTGWQLDDDVVAWGVERYVKDVMLVDTVNHPLRLPEEPDDEASDEEYQVYEQRCQDMLRVEEHMAHGTVVVTVTDPRWLAHAVTGSSMDLYFW